MPRMHGLEAMQFGRGLDDRLIQGTKALLGILVEGD
jgi:hypothetical protein